MFIKMFMMMIMTMLNDVLFKLMLYMLDVYL